MSHGVLSVPMSVLYWKIPNIATKKEPWGTEPTEELKKEIQRYVKTNTAPYKFPRLVVFRDSLPKTISGKIIRHEL